MALRLVLVAVLVIVFVMNRIAFVALLVTMVVLVDLKLMFAAVLIGVGGLGTAALSVEVIVLQSLREWGLLS